MKKIISFVFIIFISNSSFAQVFVQSENDITFDKTGQFITGTIYIQKNFNEKTKLGFSNFVLVNKNWAEMVPSITYQAGKVSLYAGIGIETAKPYYRFNAGVLYADSLNTVKLFFERGGGKKNYWYHFSAERLITSKFSVGVMSRRFYGTGLRIGFTLNKSIKLQNGFFYDTEFKVFRNSIFITYTL